MPYHGLTVGVARRQAARLRAATARGQDAETARLAAGNEAWFAEEADFHRHCEAFRHGHLAAAEDWWQKILARRALAALAAGEGGRP